MKRLLLGLMLLVTAGGASAEWTRASENDEFILYTDRATIRRNGNLVKMWALADYPSTQTNHGYLFLSVKEQKEYDCREEKLRKVAAASYSGSMGTGKVVLSTNVASSWEPIYPDSMGEAMWKIACGKK